jgi:hypothetical protein
MHAMAAARGTAALAEDRTSDALIELGARGDLDRTRRPV